MGGGYARHMVDSRMCKVFVVLFLAEVVYGNLATIRFRSSKAAIDGRVD